MFGNGTVGPNGPFDGIVTLNSAAPIQFNRPPSGNNFDGQRFIEHEIDQVIGLGSYLNIPGIRLRPQDLFSWSSRGTRNITSAGVRYFSINGGSTNIVNFNQNPNFDFGDWLSSRALKRIRSCRMRLVVRDNSPTSRLHRRKASILTSSVTTWRVLRPLTLTGTASRISCFIIRARDARLLGI